MMKFVGLFIVLLAFIRCGLGQTTDTISQTNDVCPYDEAAADVTGRRCNRDAACTGGSDRSDCKGNRRCKCDDICGFVCIKVFQDYFCDVDDLPTLTIGLSYELSTDPVRFDTTATYSCSTGYELSDESLTVRRCRGDERWSGETPTCLTGIACIAPPKVERTTNIDNGNNRDLYAIGERLTYSCDYGYYQLGNGNIYCEVDVDNPETAKWTNLDEGFDCQLRSCGSPGTIRNGYRDGNVFTFSGEVWFYCNDGYRLTGRNYRVCQADGEWSGLTPTCLGVKCPFLTNPEYGDIFGTDFSFGKRVKLTCEIGFVIPGMNSRSEYATCQANEQWDLSVQCEAVDCGNPGTPVDGRRNGDDFGYNGYILFSCDDNHVIFGEKSIYCKENNQWSADTPRCLSQCILPQNPSYLDVSPSSSSSSPYSEGEAVPVGTFYLVTCRDGYSLNSDIDKWECIGGTMSFNPVCTEESCLWPKNIEYGSIEFSNNAVSGWFAPFTVATYSCDEGYELSTSGNPSRKCRLGKFKSFAPTCTETICRVPEVLHSTSDTTSSILKHRQSVTFTCQSGYQSDDVLMLTCLNGELSSVTPVCSEEPCPRLSLELHLDVAYNTDLRNGVHAVGTIATFLCDNALFYPSKNKVICSFGEFPRVTCLEFETCDEEDFANADVTYTKMDDTIYTGEVFREGVKRSVSCNNPFIGTGDPQSECLKTGLWSGTKAECKEPNCRIPHPSVYGEYSFTSLFPPPGVGYSISYPETVTYYCNAANEKEVGGTETLECDRLVLQVPQCITKKKKVPTATLR